MRKTWWKILGAIILLYTIIVGMLVPLSPGIVGVKPYIVNVGEDVKLTVEGYNTHFTKSKNIRAWLKSGETLFLESTGSNVIDDNHLTLDFSIPKAMPSNQLLEKFTIIVDNENDGYAILPDVFTIKQESINIELGESVWKNADISNLSDRGTTFPYNGLLRETIRNTYYLSLIHI